VIPLSGVDYADQSLNLPDPDEMALLGRCLLELPVRERDAVELRYLAGASTAEIAEALGVTDVNARRIVFNGLRHLRRAMREIWPTGRD
jgi:RNA polymerase sigma factor (sigma-70 family)